MDEVIGTFFVDTLVIIIILFGHLCMRSPFAVGLVIIVHTGATCFCCNYFYYSRNFILFIYINCLFICKIVYVLLYVHIFVFKNIVMPHILRDSCSACEHVSALNPPPPFNKKKRKNKP